MSRINGKNLTPRKTSKETLDNGGRFEWCERQAHMCLDRLL